MSLVKQNKFKKSSKKGKGSNKNNFTKSFVKPCFPLEEYKAPELSRNNSIEFDCRVDPSDKESRTYKDRILKFESGSPLEYVKHREHLDKLLKTQGTIDNAKKALLIKATYVGEALREWENQLDTLNLRNKTTLRNDQLKALREAHATYFFPKGALAKQRRYNRRYIRKPKFMKIHKFCGLLDEISALMKYIPPFADSQGLDDDEKLDIAEYALPNRFRKKLIEKGFDITTTTMQDFKDEVRNFEDAEEYITQEQEEEDADRIPKRGKSSKSDEKLVPCPIPGHFHPMQECRDIQRLIKEKAGTKISMSKDKYSRRETKRNGFNKKQQEQIHMMLKTHTKNIVRRTNKHKRARRAKDARNTARDPEDAEDGEIKSDSEESDVSSSSESSCEETESDSDEELNTIHKKKRMPTSSETKRKRSAEEDESVTKLFDDIEMDGEDNDASPFAF